MLAGLMMTLALSAMSPLHPAVQLEFRGAPEDAVVRCLEGCGRLTGIYQRASTFRSFDLSEARGEIKLLLRSEHHETRTIELVVHPGRNVVDAIMTRRS